MKENISFYIVGGAVRDSLMGKEPHDFDIVVEGASPEIMQKLGFISVGKSFPVFLHPVTKMEFALCRKEIKTGDKHTDFEFTWDNVTISEDLERRDFTCNALACQCDVDIATGKITPITLSNPKTIDNCYIIDNHGGFQDIHNKEIRIVNKEHFIEDPLRILRFSRFIATLDFEASEETYSIINQMVDNGMLDHLTPERIWKEMEKALQPNVNSRKFFDSMNKTGALKVILPEIYNLTTINENPKWHSAGTTYGHVMCALDVIRDKDAQSKFGALCHDIGKYVAYNNTKRDYEEANKDGKFKSLYEWVQFNKDNGVKNYYYGHDTQEAVECMEKMARRLSAPLSFISCAKDAILNHMQIWKVFDGMSAAKFYDIITNIYGTNFSEDNDLSMERLLNVCKADNDSDKTENCGLKTQNTDNLYKLVDLVVSTCKNIHLRDIPNFLDIPVEKRSEVLREKRVSAFRSEYNKILKELKEK